MLKRENQKQALRIKLQAYERLALLLERISPTKIVIRIAPLSEDKIESQKLKKRTSNYYTRKRNCQ